MSTKIYILTRGEYSSYHIEGVFDDCTLAKKAQETFGGSIEEWDLNPLKPELSEEWIPYRVQMSSDGMAVRVFTDAEDLDISSIVSMLQPGTEQIVNNWMWMSLMARNKDHAIKIANERRAFLVATGAFNKKPQATLDLRNAKEVRP